MKIILLFLVFLIIVGCNSENVAPPTDEPQELDIAQINDANKIEVVTWNIENFPKSDHADDYLTQFIEGFGADVYLFQEIQKINRFGDMMVGVDNYNYFVNNSSSSIEYGIVYKNNIVSLINTTEILIDSAYYFASRPPFLVEIEWEQNGVTKDLSIINVHYKCCSDGEDRRRRASELLYDYIKDEIIDDNIIVAGDWNDAIEEPQNTNVFQIFIDDNSNFQFVDMSIAQGNSDEWSWQGWNSSYAAIHFDHILINSKLFDEYQNNSVVSVIKAEEYFEEGSSDYDVYLSDHRPIYFQFTP